MKHEWRKQEKEIYLPSTKPVQITIPQYRYITLSGKGNPNNPFFSECIGVLYNVAYTIKMNIKKEQNLPAGYKDWAVYPLEGVWDISDEAKKISGKKLNKDDFIFELMIRQPDFISADFFNKMLELTKVKKPHPLLDAVEFKTITDGECLQMLHVGSYDNEPESFKQMEEFAADSNLKRICKAHREIYLSDFRKVPVEKLKTVLRFQVEK